MGSGVRSEVGVQGRVGGRTTANAGRESIRARGSAEMLPVVAARGKARSGGRERAVSAGSTRHRGLAHRIIRSAVHGRRIARVGHDGRTGSASTTPKAAHILREVVVATHFVTALPVTGTERYHTAAAAHAASMAHRTVVAHVLRRGAHGRRAVASTIAITHLAAATRASREGTAEASRAALEVGEAARRAGPVARPGSVLTRGEGRENIGGSVQDAARRRRDLDGLLVQGTAIHAQTLGSLAGEQVVSTGQTRERASIMARITGERVGTGTMARSRRE